MSEQRNGSPARTGLADEVLEHREIAIGIADAAQFRLLEGVALQLHLDPLLFSGDPSELRDRKTALIVADEPLARRLREYAVAGGFGGSGFDPAIVAVVPPNAADGLPLVKDSGGPLFDGVLTLPQPPSIILAQLSVILYAHRANRSRYESAMEELMLNRRIFRSVTSGISIASALEPDMPLIYVNPAFEVMTGYTFEEVRNNNCRFLQKGDQDQPGLTLVREALKEKRETVAILRNYKKDGTPFWNELSLSPITDREGRLTHFVGIQNDVSARVAFEEALRESEKLAAVGRLAASIAHEINNPLEAVTNLIYLARSEPSLPEKDTYLARAEEELRRAALLTHQSLRFYKQSSKPQAIRLTDLVSSVLDMFAVKLKNYDIEIDRRFRTQESIVCLESEIRQVVSNLVRNAMEAMLGGGGRLSVRIREASDPRTGVKGLSLLIADTGTGMSHETRSKLFTAFHTTKGVGGTGLGLWVSAEIVERHHGKLRVRSRQAPLPCGTVFLLRLPYQAIGP